MAEAASKECEIGTTKEKTDNLECAVCLQPCIHPAQLPCGHIFCFLCVKGFANQNKRCAMCRQEIPRDFIDQPNLIQVPIAANNEEGFDGGYQWFYEGRNGWWRYDERANEDIEQAFKLELPMFELIICGELYVVDFQNNFQYPKSNSTRKRSIKRDKVENVVVKGWWQYDERTSQELEISYKKGEKTSELLIAGFLYIIDLENMLQLRRNDPSRRRKIKRDIASIPKKGIAGLRGGDEPLQIINEIRPNSPVDGRIEATADTPTNTPQSSSTSGQESPLQQVDDLQDRINALSLEETNTSVSSAPLPNGEESQHNRVNTIREGYRERNVSLIFMQTYTDI